MGFDSDKPAVSLSVCLLLLLMCVITPMKRVSENKVNDATEKACSKSDPPSHPHIVQLPESVPVFGVVPPVTFLSLAK